MANWNPEHPFDKIICPICFRREGFSHRDVHFRVSDASVHVATDGIATETRQIADELLGKKSANWRDEKKEDLYVKVRDDNLEEFWNRFDDKSKSAPVNPVLMPGEWTSEEYTGQGMLQSVLDKLGNKSDSRLCPYCHNSLPSGYGLYDTRHIAVIGTRGCGKTVFLSQFLKLCFDRLGSRDGITVFHSQASQSFYRKEGRAVITTPKDSDIIHLLPNSTTAHTLEEEIISLDLKHRGKYLTLVLHDIAGENCIEADNMRTYGPFIQNADALIYLISPQDISDGGVVFDSDGAQNVIGAIHGAFMSAQTNRIPADKIPFALTMSKSDMLEGKEPNLPDPCELFKDLETDRPSGGFQMNRYQTVKHIMEGGLMPNEIIGAIGGEGQGSFKNYGVFAVSALGSGAVTENVGEKTDKNDNPMALRTSDRNVLRIEEPLLWILYKFGFFPEKVNKPPRKKSFRKLLKNL